MKNIVTILRNEDGDINFKLGKCEEPVQLEMEMHDILYFLGCRDYTITGSFYDPEEDYSYTFLAKDCEDSDKECKILFRDVKKYDEKLGELYENQDEDDPYNLAEYDNKTRLLTSGSEENLVTSEAHNSSELRNIPDYYKSSN